MNNSGNSAFLAAVAALGALLLTTISAFFLADWMVNVKPWVGNIYLAFTFITAAKLLGQNVKYESKILSIVSLARLSADKVIEQNKIKMSDRMTSFVRFTVTTLIVLTRIFAHLLFAFVYYFTSLTQPASRFMYLGLGVAAFMLLLAIGRAPSVFIAFLNRNEEKEIVESERWFYIKKYTYEAHSVLTILFLLIWAIS